MRLITVRVEAYVAAYVAACVAAYARVLTCVTLGMAVCFAAAADNQVDTYFRELRSLSAWFVQSVRDEKGDTIQVSSGKMFMQKPRKFRWDYTEPYLQTIVADGSRVWLYDKDLEQVTVRAMEEALSSAPLAVLSGVAPIAQSFVIRTSAERAGIRWYELIPRDKESEFSLLRLAFAAGQLVTIELEDALKQTTRLSLENVQRNVKLDNNLFIFKPPAGVDVVGDTQ